MEAAVSQLFVYPIKSLKGIELSRARLDFLGFQWDRHWMLINDDGGFLSQRKFPKMVLIKQAITDTHIVLSKMGMSDLFIELEDKTTSPPFNAKIWKDTCEVVDEGRDASQWLSEALASTSTVRLVRMAKGQRRPQSKPELLGAKTTTLFADAAPFLICNQHSLERLNQSMRKNNLEEVTIERFRPNIVVNNIPAFSEHSIKELIHKYYTFQHTYPCQRCIMPTIDIETGEPHPQQQPFNLISDLNSMPDNPLAPAFGENAILVKGKDQFISVGDQLNLIDKD